MLFVLLFISSFCHHSFFLLIILVKLFFS
jgi:hypothetical protein